MIIDTTDVLEIVFTSAKTSLQESHAKLIASLPDITVIMEDGHTLTQKCRTRLVALIEQWDEERLWFLSDGRGGISLEDVCEAAGTKVEIVRAFYQDWLVVPFDIKKTHSVLMWENSLARDFCGICASERCEAPQTLVHDEGGETREGLAGSDRLRVEGTDSVHRTEEAGRGAEGS